MKCCFFYLPAVLAAVTLCGQNQSVQTQYTTDLSGHRVPLAAFSSDGKQQAELTQSVNGRTVPLEKSESKILSESANSKVIETIVRKYDANGQVVSTQRTVTDEQKRADGSSTIKANVFYSDTNGNMREGERRVIETKVAGNTTTAEVSISRTGMDGSFQDIEKRKVVTTETREGKQENESIFRRLDGGQFGEAIRTNKSEQKKDGQTITNAERYERDFTGRLSIAAQEVTTAQKNPDGTEVVQVNQYGFADGKARTEGGTQPLKEQQTIVRKVNPDGTVSETVSVRRPTLADGNRLGDPRVILQTVCTGACVPPAEPAKPEAAKAEPAKPAAKP